eukprot:3549805-Prymnesium_polylepis.1
MLDPQPHASTGQHAARAPRSAGRAALATTQKRDESLSLLSSPYSFSNSRVDLSLIHISEPTRRS